MTEAMHPVDWPATGTESRPWAIDADAPMSRRARRTTAGPYLAAVVPAIAEVEVRLPSTLLAEADDATRALVEFDRGVGALPLPFDAILLRTESASSSEVEQLTASAKQVALAEYGAARSRNAPLIAANTAAMRRAIDDAARIDETAIIDVQRTLLADDPRSAWITGGWRDQQVWIGGRASPHTADFVPPHHERVPAAMADLVRFADRVDVPALVHAALTHAQFETIHPFADGNGRTGRVLLHAMLRRAGVLKSTTVPVSVGLLAARERYFAALDAYREGDAGGIVATIVDSAFFALDRSRRLVDRMHEVRRSWGERLRAREGSAARRALDLLPGLPVVSIARLAEALEVSTTAGAGAVERLVDAGIVEQLGSGARNRLWTVPEVLDALDEFAASARRGPAPGRG